jgi:predicted MFS family arabinose efflux permease
MFSSPRAAIMLTFAAFGAVVGSHIGALPVILKTARVNPEFFGRTQAFAMISALIAVSVAGVLSRRFTHRTIMLVTLPAVLIALIYALQVQTPASYLVSNLMLAFTLSFVDLNMNAEGSDIEQEVKRPIFTSFHALLSMAVAGAAIFSSFMSVNVAVWTPAAFAAVFIVWALVLVYRNVPHRAPHAVETGDTSSNLPRLRLTLIGLTIGLSNSCEIAAMLWAGQLLSELAPQLIAYSGLGVAFFGLTAGIMRLAGDTLRKHYSDTLIVCVSLALATAGFAVLGFKPGFAVSVFAFAAVGTGLGFVFPYLYALAGRQAPRRRAAAMAFSSTVSGGPRFVFPWLLGVLATWYGVSAVFIICALLAFASLLMIALVLANFTATPAIQKGASLR